MPKTNEQPIVGASGDVYTAPVNTPIPTDINAPAAPWVKLGMISEDGVSWTPPEEETEEIKIWQSPYPARVVTTGLTSSMSFALDGWDRVTIPFALGGGSFEDIGTAPDFTGTIFHPPGPGESESRAIFLKVLDGDPDNVANPGVVMGLYFAKGRVTGRDDTAFKPDEAALLNVEFSLEVYVDPTTGDASDPYNLVFDPNTFPATMALPAGAVPAGGNNTVKAPNGTTAATPAPAGTAVPA